ncbi:MAG: D-alanine--D-alanine ligase [Candidatus Mycalebacterium zealandia]|nr:MAG: D-alanine--D-alanine ligase [Candidatus Mycalebacterium zealandia]
MNSKAKSAKPGRGRRKTVAVFFGGRSAEHEISIVSARSVLKNIDRSRFSPLPVFIDRKGLWRKTSPENPQEHGGVSFVPAPGGALYGIKDRKISVRHKVDAAFPVLHGTDGEDGAAQGLFEIWGIPYVGARVLGAALSADKLTAKRLLKSAGLPVTRFCGLDKKDWKKNRKNAVSSALREVGVPCFVKPVNLGSSIGIERIDSPKAAGDAVARSFEFCDTVIFENAVENAREIEVSVMGTDSPRASVAGEVVPVGDFYDYKAKYGDAGSKLIIPASLPVRLEKKIRSAALKTFSVLRCSAMARIDFLLNPDTGEFFVSELNAIPGFTQISMYPKLWEASGVPYRDLISRLIDLAFESAERKKSLKTDCSEK